MARLVAQGKAMQISIRLNKAQQRQMIKDIRLSSRIEHPEDTVIDICGRKIGGGNKLIIGGPCAVESKEQILAVALAVKDAGADILRGGAYKPRTSPYDFQGLGEDGIKYLVEAKKETGLPIVSEILDAADLPIFEDVDILQIGSRNMQNFSLLKAVGRTDKAILLKRGVSATYEELLESAEYIMNEGNSKVILCERGIRTFETYTRNTLDIAAVPVLKKLSHLPVIVDPSHATGRRELIAPMAMAANAAGADGLMIEVHLHPDEALSDGMQSITAEAYADIIKGLK